MKSIQHVLMFLCGLLPLQFSDDLRASDPSPGRVRITSGPAELEQPREAPAETLPPAALSIAGRPLSSEVLAPQEIVPDVELPPLEEELFLHGGAHLYEPEGDKRNWVEGGHSQVLRLPEDFEPPQPFTLFQEFEGADPIHHWPGWQWFGDEGFQWEPRFVGYGTYEVFGIAVQDGRRRTDGVGHQLLLDLDFRLTGTERFHAQFRPLGEKNSGGSFYQFNDPSGYIDNSTISPDRFWFEGEFYSLFADWIDDPTRARDYHFVVGRFPFALHNRLLMDDDIIGFAVNKNTIFNTPLSNLNVQLFYAFDDVDALRGANADVAGLHLSADYRLAFFEFTYASLYNTQYNLDADYTALSATQFFGTLTLAGRVLARWDRDGARGDGQLYVIESNYTRRFNERCTAATGVEYGVFYWNAFAATEGWTPISGGNFNRLRSTFEVNPLVQIARGRDPDDTIGAALGVQLFRHHEDESIIPEIAWERPGGTNAWGFGLRYLRKLGKRTYLDVRGLKIWSRDEDFERDGIFVSTFFVI